MPSFIADTFERCYENLPTPWRRHEGACLNEQSLNLYEEYLFGFETLIFATLQILYAQTACNTPKTKENMKSQHMTPLKYQYFFQVDTLM